MNTVDFLILTTPENIQKEHYVSKIQSTLRNDIYFFLLKRKAENEDSEDEYNEYFDLTNYLEWIDTEDIQTILKELASTGWKYELRYGGTSLFIFIGDLPAKCKY